MIYSFGQFGTDYIAFDQNFLRGMFLTCLNHGRGEGSVDPGDWELIVDLKDVLKIFRHETQDPVYFVAIVGCHGSADQVK